MKRMPSFAVQELPLHAAGGYDYRVAFCAAIWRTMAASTAVWDAITAIFALFFVLLTLRLQNHAGAKSPQSGEI